jgi:hypothetical protein
MYIVGHCFVASQSGLFDESEIYGPGLRTLMLPDYTSCHDWAYAQAWETGGVRALELVRAHMIGDWVVHYGTSRAEPRVRRGWVYARMGPAVAFYDEFFTAATRAGLRADEPPRDSKRGFSHSMVEYAIDTWLSRRGVFDAWFEPARAELLEIRGDGGLAALLGALGIESPLTGEPAALAAEVAGYRDGVERSTAPEDFAFHGAARKFGLVPGEESRAFVASYQDRLLEELDGDEIATVCDLTVDAMKAPEAMPTAAVAGWGA